MGASRHRPTPGDRRHGGGPRLRRRSRCGPPSWAARPRTTPSACAIDGRPCWSRAPPPATLATNGDPSAGGKDGFLAALDLGRPAGCGGSPSSARDGRRGRLRPDRHRGRPRGGVGPDHGPDGRRAERRSGGRIPHGVPPPPRRRLGGLRPLSPPPTRSPGSPPVLFVLDHEKRDPARTERGSRGRFRRG